MKWLITGGCGFIGTSLIRRLVRDGGHQIRVLDNLSTGTREDLERVTSFSESTCGQFSEPTAGMAELVIADIMDRESLESAAQGMDVIVHLAANTGVGPSVVDPRHDCMINVVGTFNALEAARHKGVRRFIFASSGAPAGEVEPPIHEELPPHPVAPYGASKLAGEGYCSAYYHSFGLDTVALRFGNVYGPGSVHKGSVVAKFIKHALDGEPLEIFGDGSQTRDFIYIEDLVRAIESATTTPGIGGETFQIATSRETTVGEMAETLVQILRHRGITNIQLTNGEKRVGDVTRNYSDTRKALHCLKWEPEFSLEKGLFETVGYFLSMREKQRNGDAGVTIDRG